jgi:elongation factor G
VPHSTNGLVRTLALVGPTGAGKTTLLEAILLAVGAIAPRAGAAGEKQVGDSSPEAKSRGHSVELNLANFEFMGERYAVVDAPGSVEFSTEADAAIPAVDLAIIVAEPDPAKAVLLQPALQELERLGVPRALFVNKMDQARGPIDDLLAALAPVSAKPLVARQLPILEGEKVTGFVDLALERAFIYRHGQPSEQVDLTPDLAAVEADARFHMLEQLADFDDELMGLLKALRHETPTPDVTAARLGLSGPSAYVLKTSYAGQAGRLAYARVFGTKMADGADLTLPDGEHGRVGGLFAVQGGSLKKTAAAEAGDVVAIGKLEQVAAGDVLTLTGRAAERRSFAPHRPPLFAIGVAAKNRQDDVRVSGALSKLVEEDPGLELIHDSEMGQVLLAGQGEGHVRLALDRLKRRFGVEVATDKPRTPYRETIQKGVTQRGRHKKQTGGHGQFGDVTVEIRPLNRGAGFTFTPKITGGVVPKQWIPAVEQGARDGLHKGPLGFPVVDLEVTLIDGSHHSVDSSEMAFRTAGRIAIEEGLRGCGSVLLEPIEKLVVFAPSSSLSNITSALSSRRGQILGFGPRDGWPGWEQIEAYLPQSERHDLIAEIRSITQGLGTFESDFDHMAEVTGRLADEIAHRATGAA